ncbi:cytochrome P450 [Streptosporangium sp. NPDC001559]|uniref:cytochrome P450 n=1 Tax=Streptosporangium sp. NPDC001559 TaxID=3366187 RepID=UPI0036EBA3F8
MTTTPTSPHMRRDGFHPDPWLVALRDSQGVGRISTPHGDAWLVTRAQDVRAVLGDPQRFSNERVGAFHGPAASGSEGDAWRLGNLIALDPPKHTRLRRLLAPHFTARRVQRLEPRITQIVARHLDAMEHAGPPADLLTCFALPIPLLVICELLGVPYAERDGFQHAMIRMVDPALSAEEHRTAAQESAAYFHTLAHRIMAAPGPGLLAALVRDHRDELTPERLAKIATMILVAGHETMSSMLALLRHPGQLHLLRREPGRVDAAVEELLRWLGVIHCCAAKVTTTEVEIAGQRIGPGEVVLCALAVANRDPGLVTVPDVLDITRPPSGHLALGYGVHHCLGAALGRLEMRIAFPALLQRFPALRPCSTDTEFRSFHIVHGLSRLPVTW